MREIKFRMWNTATKYMYADTGLTSLGLNDAVKKATKADYILMQFTGLKDKNGQEIYEGDRCNVLFANGEKHKAEVVFIDGCFELNFYYPIVIGGHYNDRDYLKCSTVNHAVEVIGNTYENPELLEVK